MISIIEQKKAFRPTVLTIFWPTEPTDPRSQKIVNLRAEHALKNAHLMIKFSYLIAEFEKP